MNSNFKVALWTLMLIYGGAISFNDAECMNSKRTYASIAPMFSYLRTVVLSSKENVDEYMEKVINAIIDNFHNQKSTHNVIRHFEQEKKISLNDNTIKDFKEFAKAWFIVLQHPNSVGLIDLIEGKRRWLQRFEYDSEICQYEFDKMVAPEGLGIEDTPVHVSKEDVKTLIDRGENIQEIVNKYQKDIAFIEEAAFANVHGLKSVKLNAKYIGKSAFKNCTDLQTVIISDNILSIDGGAFYNCKKTKFTVPSDAIKEYLSKSQRINTEMIGIDNNLMTDKNRWKWPVDGNLIIPEGEEHIDFYKRLDIESIAIPGSFKFINRDTLRFCSNLKSIIMSHGIERILYDTCSDLKLENIIIPDSVSLIDDGAFRNCKNANFIVPSNTMKKCLVDTHHIDINNIIVDSRLSTGAWWWNVDNEGTLVIPNGIQRIDDEMIFNRNDIRSISIPNGVKSIGKWAFTNCKNLEKIVLPDSINYIGYNAFKDCNADKLVYYVPNEKMKSYLINKLRINDTNKVAVEPASSTGAWHWNVNEDGQVTVPDSLKFIDDYMLYERKDVKSVIMNSNVKRLGKFAFSSSGLVAIEIPNSLTSIDNSTFSACVDLKSITVPCNIEHIDEKALFGCRSLENINIKCEMRYIPPSYKDHILEIVSHLKKYGREYFGGQVQINFIDNDGNVFETYKYDEARKEWTKQ